MKMLTMLVLSIVMGLVGGVCGTFVILHYKQNSTQQIIRAQGFELRDHQGNTLSYWGIDKHHNPLLVFGKSTSTQEKSAGSDFSDHTVSLNAPDSQLVAIGLTGDANPFFAFRGRDSKPRASLYINEYGKPFFLLYDADSWRISLGVRQSDTPSPADNDWGLDFYPDRASIGMATSTIGGKLSVQGYCFVHRDKIKFP